MNRSASQFATLDEHGLHRNDHNNAGTALASDQSLRADAEHSGANAGYSPHVNDKVLPSLERQTFRFAESRSGSGLMKAAQAAALLTVGVFLAAEATIATTLAIQLGILAFGAIAGGIAMALTAQRDLLGYIQIDSQGMKVSSGLAGFKLLWDEIEAWEVVGKENYHQPTFQQLKLWKRGAAAPWLLELGLLSCDSRLALREALQEMVPTREW